MIEPTETSCYRLSARRNSSEQTVHREKVSAVSEPQDHRSDVAPTWFDCNPRWMGASRIGQWAEGNGRAGGTPCRKRGSATTFPAVSTESHPKLITEKSDHPVGPGNPGGEPARVGPAGLEWPYRVFYLGYEGGLQRDRILFPEVEGYQVLKGEFHIHTLYSDGQVTPEVRVYEAWRDGLDVLAITDHPEYLNVAFPDDWDAPMNERSSLQPNWTCC